MAKQIGKLTAMKVSKETKRGYYPDGGNLYLQITEAGVKSWLLRYMVNGKAKTMGLGAVHAVTLAQAREKAADCRKLLNEGIDPIAARDAANAKTQLAATKVRTFQHCATAYMDAHRASWKNAKHIWQWENTLERFAYPVFGKLPVQDIDIALVMNVLEPIWATKTETATRLRGRIESILDWATVRGYRDGENPARWRGRLQSLLPAPSKIQKVTHQPALPYIEMGAFMEQLKTQEGLAAQALQLVILTATRTTEAIKARWCEFDLNNKLWVIPAERIKTGKEHRVPLSEPALKILKTLHAAKMGEYVFPSKNGKPLSDMAMLVLLRRMKRDDITVHGFRSTFRDWCAEQTNYPREVAEAALSHAIADKVEAAYRRSDLFDKRRHLMNEWARYCYQSKAGKGKVLKIRG